MKSQSQNTHIRKGATAAANRAESLDFHYFWCCNLNNLLDILLVDIKLNFYMSYDQAILFQR